MPLTVAASAPAWTLLPFFCYLLLIAVAPIVAGRIWERNRNKLLLAALVSAPVLVYLFAVHPGGGDLLLHTGSEYVAFMALLAALYVISGGVYVRGSLAGTPLVNTSVLAIGAVLGSLVGTTGASVLLIRPLLRANERRVRTRHIVVFFIFIVSNAAGLLTPLGDPPLFLGFLRGVPFSWTLRLFPIWALVNGTLLVIFNFVDQAVLNREERERPGAQYEEVQKLIEPLRIEGGLNLVWLAGVLALIAVLGVLGPAHLPDPRLRVVVQTLALAALAGLSLLTTGARIHQANGFSWAPIVEVAVVFAGVFVCMIPALRYLEARGGALGISEPWQFFWATGALSSFLDNAPTYLTFAAVAVGVVNQGGGTPLAADNLGPLAHHPVGGGLLAAVSAGAVLMGAMTYIGNGPNFMVKAIAEQRRVPMPGFFGFMAWSAAILLPLFALVTLLFF